MASFTLTTARYIAIELARRVTAPRESVFRGVTIEHEAGEENAYSNKRGASLPLLRLPLTEADLQCDLDVIEHALGYGLDA